MIEAQLDAQIDRWLADVLRGEARGWLERDGNCQAAAKVVDRARYHGVAGLLIDTAPGESSWPDKIVDQLRDIAVAQAMWEMRHKSLLSGLLPDLAGHGLDAVVLKGTALAYDLYDKPEHRARGDTDLLVPAEQLPEVRAVLKDQGLVRNPNTASSRDDLQLQEVWSTEAAGGTSHAIDLHWQTMNTPVLEGVLTTVECLSAPRLLPRLCAHAQTMDRARMMIHVTLHRAAHIVSPYFSGSRAHYGGDRLIWAKDIALLAATFGEADWRMLAEYCRDKGIARACLDGLQFAMVQLGVAVPRAVQETLGAMPQAEPASTYLLDSTALARNWRDFRAVRDWRSRLRFAALRVFPAPARMRAKYPEMADRPIVSLYMRRVRELVRRRPGPRRS